MAMRKGMRTGIIISILSNDLFNGLVSDLLDDLRIFLPGTRAVSGAEGASQSDEACRETGELEGVSLLSMDSSKSIPRGRISCKYSASVMAGRDCGCG